MMPNQKVGSAMPLMPNRRPVQSSPVSCFPIVHNSVGSDPLDGVDDVVHGIAARRNRDESEAQHRSNLLGGSDGVWRFNQQAFVYRAD